MTLSIIVAAAENGVIGKDGKMPWRLSAESAYFKRVTLGHPVITGRKNYEAMGRPLPDRLNIIVTRQDYKAVNGVIVVHSVDEALSLPQIKDADEVFVIGGQQIYDQVMPRVDKLYLTQVHANIEGDTYFKYDPSEWKLVWSEEHQPDADNKYAFTLQQLVRK